MGASSDDHPRCQASAVATGPGCSGRWPSCRARRPTPAPALSGASSAPGSSAGVFRRGLGGQQQPACAPGPTGSRRGSLGVHDAVAGHGERHRIRRAGPGHRPHRPRMAHRARHVGIARGAPAGDRTERLPDVTLEAGCPHVERDLLGARRLAESDRRRTEPRIRFRRGALELRCGEIRAEHRLEPRGAPPKATRQSPSRSAPGGALRAECPGPSR
jgi:hypothetical protein